MGREKAKSKMQGGRVAAVILLGFLMFLKTMAGTLLHHDGSSQLHIMVSQVRKMVKSWTRQYWWLSDEWVEKVSVGKSRSLMHYSTSTPLANASLV